MGKPVTVSVEKEGIIDFKSIVNPATPPAQVTAPQAVVTPPATPATVTPPAVTPPAVKPTEGILENVKPFASEGGTLNFSKIKSTAKEPPAEPATPDPTIADPTQKLTPPSQVAATPESVQPDPTAPTPTQTVGDLIDVVNHWGTEGVLQELPEGIQAENVENLTPAQFNEILAHNLRPDSKYMQQQQRNTFDALMRQVSPRMKDLLIYEFNGGSDLETYISTTREVDNYDALDVTNPKDQITLVMDYFTDVLNLSIDQATSKTQELQSLNLLQGKSVEYKDKLIKSKAAAAEELKNTEVGVKNLYAERVDKLLANQQLPTSKLNLNDELRAYLKDALTLDQVETLLPNGNKRPMAYVENLMYKHRYGQEGNLENLMLAVLLLEYPDKFNEIYSSRASQTAAATLVEQSRTSALLKRGGSGVVGAHGVPAAPGTPNQTTKKNQGFYYNK